MKFEISKSINADITKYIQTAIDSTNMEFECIIGANYREQFFNAFIIDNKNIFSSICRYIQTNPDDFTPIGATNTVDIKITDISRFRDLRITIEGNNEILNYCRTNQYNKDKAIYINKSRLADYPSIKYPAYNLRFNMKKEEEITDTDIINKVYTLIPNAIKFYRYKYRQSYITADELFRIDLTIVKQAKDAKNLNKSGVLSKNAAAQYEIEIEFIGYDTKEDIKTICASLYNTIANILLVMNDENPLIKNTECADIIAGYLRIATDFDPKRIESELGNSRNMSKLSRHIIGPKPVTFLRKHLDKSSPINIFADYTVTDKADGDRYLLYVHDNHSVYMINNRFGIIDTGAKHKMTGTIMDGEYITRDKLGGNIKHMLLFDIYYHHRKLVADLPLWGTGNKSRLGLMQAMVREDGGFSGDHIKISVKQFEYAEGADIYKKIQKIYNMAAVNYYDNDGLIFTPAYLGVGAEPKRSDTAELQPRKWMYALKWKPHHQNTVDFLVKFIDDYVDKSGAYKIARLFVSYSNGKNKDPMVLDPIDVISGTYSRDNENGENSELVYATVYLPGKLIDTKSGKVEVSINGEVLENNMVAEFTYSSDSTLKSPWILYRIRHDKSEIYKSTGRISGTANFKDVADATLDSILNPVLKENVTGEILLNDEELAISGTGDEYWKGIKSDDTDTMARFHRNIIKDMLYGIQYANNKGGAKLYEIAVGQGADIPRWIYNNYEYIVGSDIYPKNLYEPGKLYSRLASSISNGDYDVKKKKMVFYVSDAGKLWNKSYFRELIDVDQYSKNIADIIYGYKKLSQFKEADLALRPFHELAGKFDVVSCMFAIHYMFKNMDTLNALANNIAGLLRNGGYFIGCTFDGFAVDELLTNMGKPKPGKIGNSLIVSRYKNNDENDALIWSIEKRYDRFNRNNPLDNLGKTVNVYIDSIGQNIDEYLVDFELLVMKLGEHGIKPVSGDEVKRLQESTKSRYKINGGSNMFDTIYADNNMDRSDKYKMTDAAKTYSFLNRWFIFKKI
jgi:SAM-dependent methyltransferase